MSGRPPRRLSVICVTYNSAAMVGDALSSAIRSASAAGWDSESVVIDNASSDASIESALAADPAATVLPNEGNLGFGVANNQAFAVATGEYWLLINPDATIEQGGIGHLAAFLDAHPRAAAVAPTVRSAEGHDAESCGMAPSVASMLGHFLFLNRLLPGDTGGPWRGFQLHHRGALIPRSVDWLGAMVVLVRPAAIRAIDGFDARFFLYAEDVDLGERLRAQGWQLWLEPRARAHHLIAGSQGGVSTGWVDALHDLYASRSNRVQTFLMDTTLFVGLAIRSLVATKASESRPLHRRRMMAASRRAGALLLRSLRGQRESRGDGQDLPP